MSEITLKQLEARPFLGIRRKVPVAELAPFFTEAFPKVMGWLGSKGIQPASMPMAVWCEMNMETGVADCHAGCFVHDTIDGEGEITADETQSGDVLTLTHTGPYATVGASWMALYKEAGRLGRTPGPGWEIYVDDPTTTAAESLRTQIHLPLV